MEGAGQAVPPLGSADGRPIGQPPALTAAPANAFEAAAALPVSPPPPPANTSVPERYAVALPSGFVPAHVTLDLSERNPVVQDYMTWARSANLSQQHFDEGLQRLVSAATSHIPDPAAEIAKLGDHGPQRVQRTVSWIKGAVSQQAYAALARQGISADYIAALEELMQLAGEPKFAPDGAVPPTAITRESVQEMMKDERYWRTKDPKYIAEVEAAWKQVVGSGVISTQSRPNTRGGRAA